MTKNFAARVAQHGKRCKSIVAEYKNISSKGAARGLEQLKIDSTLFEMSAGHLEL
jgi:hypothetical protein